VSWLQELRASEAGRALFPWEGVQLPGGEGAGAGGEGAASGARAYSWAQWSAALRASFEARFWVPATAAEDGDFGADSARVGARCMFRDTVGASGGWPDYQLRPNALVAMAVAPALFTPARADGALLAVEQQLLGAAQLGVKTLDPADWAYRPAYDNASDADAATGRGFNYHNGPEWLWPFGYYLRARLAFPPPAMCAPAPPGQHSGWASPAHARRWMLARLARHRAHMESAPDMGLPELTNADGAHCPDSCWSQAWSAGTLLDALYDLNALCERASGGSA